MPNNSCFPHIRIKLFPYEWQFSEFIEYNVSWNIIRTFHTHRPSSNKISSSYITESFKYSCQQRHSSRAALGDILCTKLETIDNLNFRQLLGKMRDLPRVNEKYVSCTAMTCHSSHHHMGKLKWAKQSFRGACTNDDKSQLTSECKSRSFRSGLSSRIVFILKVDQFLITENRKGLSVRPPNYHTNRQFLYNWTITAQK